MKQILVKRNFQIKTLLLSILILGSQNSDAIPKCNLVKVGAAAAIATACGFGAYKLFYTGPAYYQKLIDDSTKDIHRSQNYMAQVIILKNKYPVDSFSDFERRTVIDSINENILQDLQSAISYEGVNDYLSGLKNMIASLKNRKHKLSKYIYKLRDNLDYARFYHSMNNISDSLVKLVPQLEFLYDYVYNHQSYFPLNEKGRNLNQKHVVNIGVILNSVPEGFEFDRYTSNSVDEQYNQGFLKFLTAQTTQQFKEYAIQNYDSSYPYIKYVDDLTKDINAIESNIKALKYRYPHLLAMGRKLENVLRIIRLAVKDRDYFDQKKQFDQDEQMREKIAKDQALKQREIDAIRERNEAERLKAQAMDREARARELQILANGMKQNQQNPQIYVIRQ